MLFRVDFDNYKFEVTAYSYTEALENAIQVAKLSIGLRVTTSPSMRIVIEKIR